jgi:putative hydrolase of the HAD superfamily
VAKAVIFDFYGTLVTERPGEIASDVAILEQYGYHELALERLRWIDPVTSLDHAEFSGSRAAYVLWQRRQWLEHLQDAGVAEHHLEVLADHAATRSGQRQLEVFDDTVAALEALRAAGILVAVCSNWGWDLADAIEACRITELVDVQVTSAQAGYRKPHRGIFEAALERLGLPAAQVVFVGDDWSADVEGSLALGMRAFHIVRAGRLEDTRPGPPIDRVRRIDGLAELVQIVTETAG